MTKSLELEESGSWFQFDRPGASVTGKIADFEEVQQTDMETGAPAVWPDGRAKMALRIDLAVPGLEDTQSIMVRGSKKSESGSTLSALIGAIKASTGGSQIHVGAELTMTYVKDGEATKRGYTPPKMYTAKYVAPSRDLAPTAAVEAAPVAAKALSPAEMEALMAGSTTPMPAPVDVIAAHPQGAALRAAGVADDVIKASLGLA